MRAILFCLVLFAASVSSYVEALTCMSCELVDCNIKNLSKCKYGTVKDVCHCCDVCAKGPGESCGGMWEMEGKCATGLRCRTETPPPNEPTTVADFGFITGRCVKA
ncbi:hypothetical protein CHUAL_009965 [Chamberlinius hualienensis]